MRSEVVLLIYEANMHFTLFVNISKIYVLKKIKVTINGWSKAPKNAKTI